MACDATRNKGWNQKYNLFSELENLRDFICDEVFV